MSAEEIKSIVEGKNSIGEVFTNVESIRAPEEKGEILEKNIQRTLENYERAGVKKWELSMGCGKVLFSNLLPLHFEFDTLKDKKVKSQEDEEKIKSIQNKIGTVTYAVEKYYKKKIGNDWEQVFSGFAAEVACAMALKQGGFEVFIPDKDDDTKGKIDLLVFDKENTLFSIQVKSSSLLKNIVIEDLSRTSVDNVMGKVERVWDDRLESGDSAIIDSSATKLKEFVNTSYESCQILLEYLSPVVNKKNVINVIPIYVAIPGGGSERAMYNYRTGYVRREGQSSTSLLSDKLCDKLFSILDNHEGGNDV